MTPPSQPESLTAFNQLEESVSQLEQVAAELHRRLEGGGILHPVPSSTEGNKQSSPYTAPLSQSIHAKAMSVDRVTNLLSEMIDKLAV